MKQILQDPAEALAPARNDAAEVYGHERQPPAEDTRTEAHEKRGPWKRLGLMALGLALVFFGVVGICVKVHHAAYLVRRSWEMGQAFGLESSERAVWLEIKRQPLSGLVISLESLVLGVWMGLVGLRDWKWNVPAVLGGGLVALSLGIASSEIERCFLETGRVSVLGAARAIAVVAAGVSVLLWSRRLLAWVIASKTAFERFLEQQMSAAPVHSSRPEEAAPPGLLRGAGTRLLLTVCGGAGMAVAVSILWCAFEVLTTIRLSLNAIFIGIALGLTVRSLARSPSVPAGLLGAILTLGSCVLRDLLTASIVLAEREDRSFLDVLMHLDGSFVVKLELALLTIKAGICYGIAAFLAFGLAYSKAHAPVKARLQTQG